MLGDRCLVAAESRQGPLARRLSVGHRLKRREGLGRDHEQRLGRIEIAGRLNEVGRVDVRDEPECHVASRVVAQRLVCHLRTEVGAADADVDHVSDRLTRVPAPETRPHALAEGAHAIENLVDLLDDVDPVDDQRAVAGHAQRDVEDRSILGNVDVIAAEHRLAQVRHPALLGELCEQGDRLVRDPVLGVVEVQAGRLGCHAGAAIGIRREEVAQVPRCDLGVVRFERPPGLAVVQGAHRRGTL